MSMTRDVSITATQYVFTMPIPNSAPEINEKATLARYPFLPQAKPWFSELIQRNNFEIDDLIEGERMQRSRERGRLRLVEAITHEGGVGATNADIHTEEGIEIEAFSYYYSRFVVCASTNDVMISRWAQAEAERAQHLLEIDEQSLPLIAQTYLTNIDWESEEGTIFKIGLSDFIELSPKITGARWRLANQDIKKGWIKLNDERNYSSRKKLSRLLRERIKQEILKDANEISAKITDDIKLKLENIIETMGAEINKISSEKLDLSGINRDDWPPCMKRAVLELSNGVNVNHYGRLFLASMAQTINISKEECVNFFKNAPDFSAETTAYQVNNIYETGYTPANCSKLKINACCAVSPGDDSLCDQEWMTHPLKYLKAKQKN